MAGSAASGIDGWFDGRAQALIRDLGRLIAVESVRGEALPGAPYGPGPAAALAAAADMLAEKGFAPRNFENRVVTADINGRPPELGILAHLDVVAVGAGWTTDPFQAAVRDGAVYGRGAIDNKGPAVAAIYAMEAARAIAPDMTRGCRLILGSAEETGHDDLTRYRQRHEMPPNVMTPDSSYPVVNVEKGRLKLSFFAAWQEGGLPRLVSLSGGRTANAVPERAQAVLVGLPPGLAEDLCAEYAEKTGARLTASRRGDVTTVTAVGVAAHAMCPQEGINAQTALLALLDALPLGGGGATPYLRALAALFPHGDTSGKALGVEMEDELSGPLTVNFGVLDGGSTGLEAAIDCRCPACATEESLDAAIIGVLTEHGFKIIESEKIACHHTAEDSPFVRTLLSVYEAYTGRPGTCLAVGGQTYVHGIEGGVAFGPAMPGSDNRLHGADEFIRTDELLLCAKMYTRVILEMCR